MSSAGSYVMLIPLALKTGSTAQFITVFVIFIFVLVLTYLTTRFVGSFQKTRMSGSNISVIEAMRIGNNKYIEIVDIAGKYYAIAVGKDSVTLIGEVDKDALKTSSGVQSFESFESVLNRFRHKDVEKTDENVEEDGK